MPKDLANILKEEWFNEMKGSPVEDIEGIDLAAYESEVLPNYMMHLSIGEESKDFYVEHISFEPIGDYGRRAVSKFYRCNNNEAVRNALVV